MKTKLFTFCFALALSVGTIFAEKVRIGDLYYNLNATSQIAQVTYQYQNSFVNYSGLMAISIPENVIYNAKTYRVTSIGSDAFNNCSSLTSVTIPNSVKSIGDGAFYDCSGLNSVTIGNSVKSIGKYAFCRCESLTSVTIPKSVTSIGDGPFSYCSGLTSINVESGNATYDSRDNCNAIIESATNTLIGGCQNTTIPNSVTSIGNSVFSGCRGLTSVTIPNSVSSIGNRAFIGCSGLTSINVESGNATYDSRDNSNAIIESVTNTLIVGCQNTTIPNSVTSIGDMAFFNCSSLTSVTIPNSVSSIGYDAFSDCSGLNSVTIGNSVKSIGKYAFCRCESLTSVTIPKSVTSIGGGAFSSCRALTSVTIGNSVTSIGYDAFNDCSNLTSVTIGNSVTSIGEGAFYNCPINEIRFTGSIEEWLTKSWRASSLSSDYALFINNELQSTVIIPNSVKNIGDRIFSNCNSVQHIILGSSLMTIGNRSFDCPNIETITCYSMRPPTVYQFGSKYYSFPENLYYNTIVYVPAEYQITYLVNDFWGLFDVRPLGATTTETTDLVVTPSDNTAEVVWPAVSGAATYELVIKDKDGNVICTLIFNSNGQLTSIAFNAPSRDHAPQQTQSSGFSFTVTGLEKGNSYDLTITAKNGTGATLDEKSVSFTTGGEQGLDQITNDQSPMTNKILRDGQILILRGDKTYTTDGRLVH